MLVSVWSESIINTQNRPPVFLFCLFMYGVIMAMDNHIKNQRLKVIILYALWVFFTSLPYIYYSYYLKFPSITSKKHICVILLVYLIPMFLGIIGKLLKKEKMYIAIFALFLIFNVVSVIAFTMGFTINEPYLYPIFSHTTDKENYLIIDENLMFKYEGEELLHSVFPDSISQNATDVEYYYWCDTGTDSLTLSSIMTLPLEEYESECERISQIGLHHRDETSYDFICEVLGEEVFELIVEFDDQQRRIKYYYNQGTVD